MPRLPKTRTVLVVEDDPTIRALELDVLVAGGYRVLEAPDGSAGLELLAQHRPDVVVLDLALPGASGLDVLQAVRRDRRARLDRVIVVSAHPELLNEPVIREVAGVVGKPFRIGELLDRVDATA